MLARYENSGAADRHRPEVLSRASLQRRERRIARIDPQSGGDHIAGLVGIAALSEAERNLRQRDGRRLEGGDSQALVEIRDGRVFALAEVELHQILAGESIRGVLIQSLLEIIQ